MGRTETKYCYMLAIVLCFTGCQPSESSIEKAISLTKAEWTSVPSPSPYPTYTRMATVPEELTEPSVGTSVAVSTENTIGAVTQYGSPTLMLPTATPTETRISTVTSTVVATNSDYQSMAVEDPVIKVSGAVAVNIRSGPGLNYSKIGLAKPGTTATITGKTNNDEW
jgi:hypothetical protein